MRFYPREIEADLLGIGGGIDIHDWHQGRMSSRRLLLLIDKIQSDPDSMLARERRDQDWSLKEYLEAGLVNELRRLRADNAAIHAQQKLDVVTVDSPAQREESEEEQSRFRDVREHLLSQMRPPGAR
jgi:hypothetical protein